MDAEGAVRVGPRRKGTLLSLTGRRKTPGHLACPKAPRRITRRQSNHSESIEIYHLDRMGIFPRRLNHRRRRGTFVRVLA